ncbi:hypothetical protein [uncultured Parasphingopyxis sp.]|uniref:hypothetical protein n=1 Tax=uncultured Parasphingopyxis sp. TaxID=1547918 RepID=UPI002636F20F|nr:hypothetical protein [uncultured Parasphingopyxis sp.]
MAIAALIAAYQEAEGTESGLRALLPMAGRTLLEYQVRRAIGAGARHAVILVERVPAALNEALDRLRRDGIAVEIARTPADAADRFHPEEAIILVADGLIAAPPCFEALAAQRPPAVLVVPDIPENAGFERVDSQWRWAGLALTDANMLSETAAMLGDWDLQSTLMRRIVQSGPRFVSSNNDADAKEGRASIVIADDEAASRRAGRADMLPARTDDASWIERFVLAPAAGIIAPLLIDRPIEPNWLRLAAVALAIGGAVAFYFNWLWTGAILLLLPGLLAAIATRIDVARLCDPHNNWRTRLALPAVYGAAIAVFGRPVVEMAGNPLYWAFVGAAMLLLLLVERTMRKLAKLGGPAVPYAAARATATGIFWLLPLFGAFGWWIWWPAFAAAYGLLSAFLLIEFAAPVPKTAETGHCED